MRFKIGPYLYRLRICKGILRNEEGDAAGLILDREIMLSGEVRAHARSEVLFDQLRRAWETHYGPLSPDGVASFSVDMSRQLNSQGGEAALMRLNADGMIDAGAVPTLAATPVGCQCPRCETKYGEHQIKTGKPDHHPEWGPIVVRLVHCDFCADTFCWVEGANPAGNPNGRVMRQPIFAADPLDA